MNTNNKSDTFEVRAEQVTNGTFDAIYLGADLHKASISVTRIIDGSTPQPAQRFNWESYYGFVRKQLSLAKKVYVVYEAGAFGFVPCRMSALSSIPTSWIPDASGCRPTSWIANIWPTSCSVMCWATKRPWCRYMCPQKLRSRSDWKPGTAAP